jgi:Pyruvate/2-oxoacid:ferredoxin oxidoreductase delta subunit
MPKQSKFSKNLSRLIGIYLLILFGLILFSQISLNMRGKREVYPDIKTPITFYNRMTLKKFAKLNKIPEPVVKKAFNPEKGNLQRKLNSFKYDKKTKAKEIHKLFTKFSSVEKKNWSKIYLKFALWIAGLFLMLLVIKKRKFTVKSRKWIYLGSFALFGIAFGGDPSPMGTVKDAITSYGLFHTLFVPRFIALGVFLLFVVIANKSICAWGCPFGTLQDFLFRQNRDPKDRKTKFGQIKIPFIFTNSVRIIFFVVMTVMAMFWAIDFVEIINPFTIFSPYYLTGMGMAVVFSLLFMGLFVYRPWCTLFCPFGLVGWLFEKLSIIKIRVDYDKCVSCKMCAKSCPTTTMEAILQQKKVVIPDCFACMNCVETCPKDAISFTCGKRAKPPKDKFKNK